jgi:hypothetical protein
MNTQEQTKMTPILSSVKDQPKKSWALMAIESEEEEEQERKEEKQTLYKEKAKQRRDLYEKGQYELEEGEILE